jgi:CTP synthase (UTP-ammonia lyase)
MSRSLQVGIIGDYDPGRASHVATDSALDHAAAALPVTLERSWLPTEVLAGEPGGVALRRCDALWCGPGGPYKSMTGALRAIRFAREGGRPFIGT